MPPLFPIIWYVSLEQRMPEGEEGGWGPCCNAQRHGEHGHYRSATTGCTVAASLCNHLLLAGMFVLPSYLQGMGRGAMAGSTPPLQFSVLLAAPAGLPVFPCLHFPSCPPGMPQAATSVTDCPTAAAHDTGSAHPLALASTLHFFLGPTEGLSCDAFAHSEQCQWTRWVEKRSVGSNAGRAPWTNS